MEFKNHNLEYYGDSGGKEDDIDAFYMELRRQLLLLTAEDDEDSLPQTKLSNSIAAFSRGSSRLLSCSCCALQPGSNTYFPQWEGEDSTNLAPTWLVNLWSSTGYRGTGVFVPQIVQTVQCRRSCKPAARMSNGESRMYRPKRPL